MKGGIMEKLSELWLAYRHWILISGGALLVIIMFFFTSMSHNNVTPTKMSDVNSSSVSNSPDTQSTKRFIYVDVKGAVIHPGVIRLSRDARIEEALKIVKPTSDADLKQVNLAKQLTDQQVLYIPKIGEQANTSDLGTPGSANSSETGSKININTAGKNQLCEITGIGDKKADLIIQYRQEHGQFKSVDDLKDISGFGDKTVEKIKPQLSV
ncbi:PTS family cellobiose porter, IIA component [Limosilactobacillus frumenti DSM 13145]|uniref:PTS family cellobiose porter, IIA component n=2 Tax=Limosilactobacillus frumenti TaxID=104955 RepID=A0A0R1PE17_9LACO|nr:PTS family cellobiose porter, IIA component [Limosilactobacillus frumenti DSM 13145]